MDFQETKKEELLKPSTVNSFTRDPYPDIGGSLKIQFIIRFRGYTVTVLVDTNPLSTAEIVSRKVGQLLAGNRTIYKSDRICVLTNSKITNAVGKVENVSESQLSSKIIALNEVSCFKDRTLVQLKKTVARFSPKPARKLVRTKSVTESLHVTRLIN